MAQSEPPLTLGIYKRQGGKRRVPPPPYAPLFGPALTEKENTHECDLAFLHRWGPSMELAADRCGPGNRGGIIQGLQQLRSMPGQCKGPGLRVSAGAGQTSSRTLEHGKPLWLWQVRGHELRRSDGQGHCRVAEGRLRHIDRDRRCGDLEKET